MIAVTTNDKFLKRKEIEEAFPQILKEGEEWKIYPDFESMVADKDKIEILFNTSPLDKEKIKEFRNLRWIFSYSAGVEHYPQKELQEMGVILTNTSGVHSKSISEQVLGAMIMFSRNLLAAMKNREKKIFDRNFPLRELTGENLLIVGTGAIGREIARRAKAFDMKVTGIRNHAGGDLPENFDAVYSADSLEEHLSGFQYIVCVVPSTEKTRGLFDRRKFSLMDPDTVFMNVGRGDLIVEEDMIEALEKKKIRGAYLDVFPTEPLPQDSKFWDLDNLLITPHNAGPTPHYFERAIKIFSENLSHFRKGEKMINQVNYQEKY